MTKQHRFICLWRVAWGCLAVPAVLVCMYSSLRAQDGLGAGAALAALRIVDCQGFTRAAQNAQPGVNSRVEVSVSSTSNQPVELQLKQIGTDVVHKAVAENGVAVFENIPAGTFEIAAASEGVELGAISLGSMTLEAGAAAAVGVASGVAAGGAATGAVIGVNEVVDVIGGDSSSPPPAPTPAPTPLPTTGPTPCADCDPDATPPPLGEDDFFTPAKAELSPSR